MLFAPASDRAGRRILMRGGHDLISADRGDAWPRRRVFAVPPPPAPSVSTALQLRRSGTVIAGVVARWTPKEPAAVVLRKLVFEAKRLLDPPRSGHARRASGSGAQRDRSRERTASSPCSPSIRGIV